MKGFAGLTGWLLLVLPIASFAGGVRYRGIFVNDEDWGLRPWAVRHFGAEEQIGTNAYAEIFALMKRDGLNLIWPAMHEGGYEFSARPENLELARRRGVTVGTSHCEPMLRNNCYLSKADKKKWSWASNRDFLVDYWREGVRRGMEHLDRVEHADRAGDVLWTIGMRGIHDGRMPDGKTTAEKKKILEEVFAAQCAMLPKGAPKLFCPYKEVLPIFNAGLKVPEDATILWVNDNFGYVRRIGGDPGTHGRQGIYWHLSYWGRPHGYIHLCTTPPAFMWYELVAKCWANGVRDVWMVNAGDVFQAEILLDAFGKFAADPEGWGADAQTKFLDAWAGDFFSRRDAESQRRTANLVPPLRGSAALRDRISKHLAEYYNLGFNRKPEHMCVQWSRALPESVKSSLLKRYHALLEEDFAIEKRLADLCDSASLRGETCGDYFRLVGFQVRFLAYAGIIHLEGRDKDYAHSVLDSLYARWDALDGGKWAGFWIDTIDEKPGKYQPTAHNRWSSQMQWSWNEPDDPAQKDRRGESRNDYVATQYRADVPEPTWLEPVVRERGAKGGEWVNVSGLGTSGNALALLPVKAEFGTGATITYSLSTIHYPLTTNLMLQFLPDFALWPGLKLGVKVSFDNGEAKYVEVPRSDGNIGEKDAVRAVAVQDNFIRVDVPIPSGAKTATITAVDPGVVIDRVGVRPARSAIGRAGAGSSADDIARYEAVGELARDPAEKPVDAPKDMKLVLCMGQSNMAGRAKMSEADKETVQRAYKLDRDGHWVAAKAPYHFDKAVAAVGPVDEFVRRYLADHPGESIGVVPCAVGGSPFYSWSPPPKGERRGVNYAKALERAKVAQANGKFIAILWHQGETDAAKAKDETGLNESYPKDFSRMMSELRKELGEGDVPVIVGEIGRWMRPDGDHAARINLGIGKIPSLLPNSAVVSSEGLANQDRHHFDREGQRILGGRYYDAFKSLKSH